MKDKNGIEFVSAAQEYKHFMAKRKGETAANCPPLTKLSTSSNLYVKKGFTLGKYTEV